MNMAGRGLIKDRCGICALEVQPPSGIPATNALTNLNASVPFSKATLNGFLQSLCEIEPVASATSGPTERIECDANRITLLHIGSICSLQIR